MAKLIMIFLNAKKIQKFLAKGGLFCNFAA
jgi:hypothetical protein